MASKFPDNFEFKLFIEKSNELEAEVRKFSVESPPQSDVQTLSWLRKKIHEFLDPSSPNDDLQNGSENCGYKLQYIDCEGDKITIKTELELNQFLREESQPYKLHIQCSDQDSSGTSLDNSLGGLICSSCHKMERSQTFVCITCTNYNLCSRCEHRGIHPAHDMIRFVEEASIKHIDGLMLKIRGLWIGFNGESSDVKKTQKYEVDSKHSERIENYPDSSILSRVLNPEPRKENSFELSSVQDRTHLSSDSTSGQKKGEVKSLHKTESLESTNRLQVSISVDEIKSQEMGTNEANNDNSECQTKESHQRQENETELEVAEAELHRMAEDQHESLCSLREEIDQLLAPIISNQIEIDLPRRSDSKPLIQFCDIETPQESKSPRAKRSPSIINGILVEKAIIENKSSNIVITNQDDLNKRDSTSQKSLAPKTPARSQLLADCDAISVDNTSQEEESKTKPDDKPLSSDEVRELLKIVDDHERTSSRRSDWRRFDFSDTLDPYLLASSRLMLKTKLERHRIPSTDLYNTDLLASTTTKYTPPSTDETKPAFLPSSARLTTTTTATSASLTENIGNSGSSYYHRTPVETPVLHTTTTLPITSRYKSTTTRVSEALQTMLAMGFTDDDGWLTQLLTMKHGDITQVLDILTPVEKRS